MQLHCGISQHLTAGKILYHDNFHDNNYDQTNKSKKKFLSFPINPGYLGMTHHEIFKYTDIKMTFRAT